MTSSNLKLTRPSPLSVRCCGVRQARLFSVFQRLWWQNPFSSALYCFHSSEGGLLLCKRKIRHTNSCLLHRENCDTHQVSQRTSGMSALSWHTRGHSLSRGKINKGPRWGDQEQKKLFISPSLLRKSSDHPIPRPVRHTHKDLDPYPQDPWKGRCGTRYADSQYCHGLIGHRGRRISKS